MRPAILLTCFLLLASLPVAAQYHLVLTDGTVLPVDADPEVRGDTVTFLRGGMTFSLPLARVDLPASRAANGKDAGDPARPSEIPGPVSPDPEGKPGAPRRFTDEDLPSPSAPPARQTQGAKPAAAGAGTPQDATVAKPAGGDLATWSALSREEKDLISRRREYGDRIRSLEDRREALDAEDAQRRSDYARYPTDPSVVAAAQFWAEEYDRRRSAIQDDLADLQAKMAETDRELREVQLEMRDLSIGP